MTIAQIKMELYKEMPWYGFPSLGLDMSLFLCLFIVFMYIWNNYWFHWFDIALPVETFLDYMGTPVCMCVYLSICLCVLRFPNSQQNLYWGQPGARYWTAVQYKQLASNWYCTLQFRSWIMWWPFSAACWPILSLTRLWGWWSLLEWTPRLPCPAVRETSLGLWLCTS